MDSPALAHLELLVALEVEAVAGRVEHVPERDVTDGHRDRASGVPHGRTANDTIGGLQRDGPDHVVADVLGDLEVQTLLLARQLNLDGEQVVHRRHRVRGELDVDDRADDAGDATGSAFGGGVRSVLRNYGSHLLSLPSYLADARASTPPTISLISWVISAWRAWLASRVYLRMSSSALSVADFIARWRAASSEAADCSSALKSRAVTYFGNNASRTCSALGSNEYSGRTSSGA